MTSSVDEVTGCSPTGLDDGCSRTCSVWTQDDCGREQGCKAWSNTGGEEWNAARCTSLVAEPQLPGDPCEVEGGPASGVDSCDIGSMCWGVDAASNMGNCVSYCSGSPEDASCESPDDRCVILYNGWVPLCLPVCDPILQACPEGSICTPTNDGAFACQDEELQPCPAGSIEAPDGLYDTCPEEPCCVPLCLSNGDCLGGEVCVPFADPPADGFENIGVCVPGF